MKKILDNLPDSLQKDYSEIWKEYQENKTEESKLVHDVDKLEMVVQAKIYENNGHPSEKILPFIETADENIQNPKIREIFREILRS